ncbi:hypothetical protein BJ875DRAFT_217425 [Amylocarpus encephaloides]|uniref:Uncharacterized protein n=1 Tax=Amylocarpus encephaloides TaxID=45428 RepID=A0A9P7YNP3_9HELO|nr:hypothetical protein BJ875DRAFT_217425 [Amylocarpus encephaloides]
MTPPSVILDALDASQTYFGRHATFKLAMAMATATAMANPTPVSTSCCTLSGKAGGLCLGYTCSDTWLRRFVSRLFAHPSNYHGEMDLVANLERSIRRKGGARICYLFSLMIGNLTLLASLLVGVPNHNAIIDSSPFPSIHFDTRCPIPHNLFAPGHEILSRISPS